jgi:colanic acid/amylovoran biosynthesis glycosyltransferase
MNRPFTVAYIFSQYPRLTETFLDREVTALREAGLRVEIHALFAGRRPGEADVFHWWEAVRLVAALPRELIRQPALARDGWRALRRARFRSAENFFASMWAAIYAVCRAARFRVSRPDILHGVWATESATAAAILSRLCGIPFSFGAHAFDIYKQGGDAFLDAKLAAAAFVHTTTQTNVVYLRQRVPEANVILARRGLDRLPPATNSPRASGPIRILSVARLTPKKGHIHQLAACALLKQWSVPFEARIIGDGELRGELQRRIAELGLGESVTLCGAQPPERVQEACDWADIFWHTGVVDAHGDRDGLPNVIAEAFAHRLPVICGLVAGPLEAVAHEASPAPSGVNGLVVDVTDPVALATAVRRLAEDEPFRRRLGENGRRWVEENFLARQNVVPLAQAFREAGGPGRILSADAAPPTIAYIFERHPSLAQTFLKREIIELMRQGFRVEVYSLLRRRLDAPPSPPGASLFSAYDRLVVDYFHWWETARLIVALPRELRRDPALLRDGWRLLRRHRMTSPGNLGINIWAAIFAVCRAQQFRRHRPQILHGVWATGPATAAAVLSRLCGAPFSLGTDGYDVYDHGGDQFLEPKLRAASFVQANFDANAAHLRQRVPGANVVLARRGLDRLPPLTNGPRVPGPIRILSVGRLAPKKGHLHQLAACAVLKQWGVPFEARIIGGGELRRKLQRRIHAVRLTDRVMLCGGQQHEPVQQAYAWADIFWHTGVIEPGGNRDGLPNVIPEAFAHRLPVICGPVAGATEAVAHEQTGLVVDVTDPVALATAVRRLAEDEPLRRRLGDNGRRWVEQYFLASQNVAPLAEAFRRAIRA